MTLTVMTVDPGVTSGYTYAEIEPKKSMKYYVTQFADDVDDMWKKFRILKPRYIIIEDFEFRQGKQRSGINLFPVQMIGVARLYGLIADHPCAVYVQKAAQGKAYYTDKILKANGLMFYGDATNLGHGIDASRHLLQWITFGPGFEFNGATGKVGDFAKRIETWPPPQST